MPDKKKIGKTRGKTGERRKTDGADDEAINIVEGTGNPLPAAGIVIVIIIIIIIWPLLLVSENENNLRLVKVDTFIKLAKLESCYFLPFFIQP